MGRSSWQCAACIAHLTRTSGGAEFRQHTSNRQVLGLSAHLGLSSRNVAIMSFHRTWYTSKADSHRPTWPPAAGASQHKKQAATRHKKQAATRYKKQAATRHKKQAATRHKKQAATRSRTWYISKADSAASKASCCWRDPQGMGWLWAFMAWPSFSSTCIVRRGHSERCNDQDHAHIPGRAWGCAHECTLTHACTHPHTHACLIPTQSHSHTASPTAPLHLLVQLQRIPSQSIPSYSIPLRSIPSYGIPTAHSYTAHSLTAHSLTEHSLGAFPHSAFPHRAFPRRIPTQRIPTQHIPSRSILIQRIPSQSIPTQRIPTQIHPGHQPPPPAAPACAAAAPAW